MEPRSPPPGRWRPGLAAAIGIVPLAFLLAAAGLRALTREGDAAAPTLAGVGRLQSEDAPAPPFSLPALEGTGTIALRDLAGDVIVLNFWASWCGPCREEAPVLEAAWREYRGRGVRFLGVNYRDRREDALRFQREMGIGYPSAFDPDGRLTVPYGLAGVPTTVIIDRDERIAYRFLGKVDGVELRRALEDLLG